MMAKYSQAAVDLKIAEITAAYEAGQFDEHDYYLHVYPWAAGLFTIVEQKYDLKEDEQIEALLDEME